MRCIISCKFTTFYKKRRSVKRKVAFHTLGCKLNFTETSTIARSFIQNGFELTDFSKKADFYVINTCSVTDNADKKFKNILNRAKKKNPNAFNIVVGCYAQLKLSLIHI